MAPSRGKRDLTVLNSRPILRSVIDAQDLQILILNAIDNDVGQAREYQLAGTLDASLATTAWEVSQIAATIVESVCNLCGSVGIVLLNATNNIVEILGGGRGPAQAHLRPQYLLNLGADLVVLHKLSAFSGGQA